MHLSTDSHQAPSSDRPVPKQAHGPAQQLRYGPPLHPCTQAASPVPHLAAEAAGAADAVDVQLTAVGEVVVDHQRHLRAEGLHSVAGWCVSGRGSTPHADRSVVMRGATGMCTHSTTCLVLGDAQLRRHVHPLNLSHLPAAHTHDLNLSHLPAAHPLNLNLDHLPAAHPGRGPTHRW